MHLVNRGPPPAKLHLFHSSLTPRWAAFYRNRTGRKPTDARWRDFQNTLANAFYYLCGYCEEACRGEVDHFRPKERFPESVYDWRNWVYACHTCNNLKGFKWPAEGFVDPCDPNPNRWPETHFDFDLVTGEILPRSTLKGAKLKRAQNTINGLDLNAFHHLKSRQARLRLVRVIAQELPVLNPGSRQRMYNYLRSLTSRQSELSSITLVETDDLGIFGT